MNLALRDIRFNFLRFVLTTLGVGMLLMAVMGMGGIYRGIVEDATLLLDRIAADIWVVQYGTRGPFAEVSRVQQNLEDRLAAVPGVRSSCAFVSHNIQREHRGKLMRIVVQGLSWPTDKGEWLPLVAGRPLASSHYEMIADESLELGLGETIVLGKDTYTVVGLTKGMLGQMGDGLAFFTVRDALSIQFDTSGEAVRLERAARRSRAVKQDIWRTQPTMGELADRPSLQLPAYQRPTVSAVVLKLHPGTDPAAVMHTISGWKDVSVFTADGQKELLLKGTVDKVRRQIGLFRGLLVLIAGIVMALILYTLTLDKVRDIAMLKLIGARNSVILQMIMQQALLMGALAFVFAYMVGSLIFPHFPRRVIVTDEDLRQLALVVLIVSVLSSMLGIWRAMKVKAHEALS